MTLPPNPPPTTPLDYHPDEIGAPPPMKPPYNGAPPTKPPYNGAPPTKPPDNGAPPTNPLDPDYYHPVV